MYCEKSAACVQKHTQILFGENGHAKVRDINVTEAFQTGAWMICPRFCLHAVQYKEESM